MPTDAGGIEEDAGVCASRVTPGGVLDTEYCRPIAAFLCERAKACSCGDDDAVVECVERQVVRCLEGLDADGYVDGVAAGEVVVHGGNVAACIETLRRVTGDCEVPDVSVCGWGVASTAGLNEECATPFCAGGEGICECQQAGPCTSGVCVSRDVTAMGCVLAARGGRTCDIGERCTAALDGTCEPIPAASAPASTCADERECDEGEACVSNVCVSTIGDPCSARADCGREGMCALTTRPTCQPLGGLGDWCVHSGECSDDYACVGTACGPLGGVDAACEDDRDCEDGLFCIPAVIGEAAGTCQSTGGGEGEVCPSTVGSDFCAEGLVCVAHEDGAYYCQATRPGEGEACALGGDDRCDDSTLCESGVCVPRPGVGEDCSSLCLDSYCVGGTCVDTPPGEGDQCALGAPRCSPGLSCILQTGDFVCSSELPGLLEVCTMELRCASGLQCYENGDYVTGLCGLPPAEGNPCQLGRPDWNEMCPPGTFCGYGPLGPPGERRCRPHLPLCDYCRGLFLDDCGPDGWCDHQASLYGICAPNAVEGEACNANASRLFESGCGDGLRCVGVPEGTCELELCGLMKPE